MKNKYSRRDFLKAGMGLSAAAMLTSGKSVSGGDQQVGGMVAIASGRNRLYATEKAMELLKQMKDPLDAVIAAVNLVESNPDDTSVGYGGGPNEEGVVELDASVMHGPTHNTGAVASLRNIKNPSRVARLVMERTDHALLVGEGALKFAKAHGFQEENLLTEEARRKWLERKEKLSDRDFWLHPEDKVMEVGTPSFWEDYGTVTCLALDAKGDLAGATTTSGHFFKIPGRVGDSPIIGAGLYVDNDVGAAGSTGRGEANIINLGSYKVVEFMSQGSSPEEACLKTLERISQKTKLLPYLLNEDGVPRFNLCFYALNKKGEYGAASMWSGNHYAVHDGKANQKKDQAYLYRKKER